jgi:hypothetical protein
MKEQKTTTNYVCMHKKAGETQQKKQKRKRFAYFIFFTKILKFASFFSLLLLRFSSY